MQHEFFVGSWNWGQDSIKRCLDMGTRTVFLVRWILNYFYLSPKNPGSEPEERSNELVYVLANVRFFCHWNKSKVKFIILSRWFIVKDFICETFRWQRKRNLESMKTCPTSPKMNLVEESLQNGAWFKSVRALSDATFIL